jgi:hypothetical protein
MLVSLFRCQPVYNHDMGISLSVQQLFLLDNYAMIYNLAVAT